MRPLEASQVSLSLDQRLYHIGPIFCPLAQKFVPPKMRLLSTFQIPAALEIDVLDTTRRPPDSVLGTPFGSIVGIPVRGRLGFAGDGVQGCVGE